MPVIPFPGVEFIDQGPDEQPQEEVVALLEEMLAAAESGELQAVAIAGITFDGVSLASYSAGNSPHIHNLLAAVLRLQHKIMDDPDPYDEDEDTGC